MPSNAFTTNVSANSQISVTRSSVLYIGFLAIVWVSPINGDVSLPSLFAPVH